jgi:hypothetical protein
LIQAGGDSSKLPEGWEHREQYREDMNHLEGLLKKAPGIPRTVAYATFRFNGFGLYDYEYINPYENYSLVREKVDKLDNNFYYGILTGYIEFSLVEPSPSDIGDVLSRFQFKIDLPAGTKVIPTKEDRFIIDKDQGVLKLGKLTIVNKKGFDYLRANVEHRDKLTIQAAIKKKEEEINKIAASLFGLSALEDRFIRLQFDNLYPFGAAESVEKALEEMRSPLDQGGLPKQYLECAARFMEMSGGRITFTDRLLGFSTELQEFFTDIKDIMTYNKAGGITVSPLLNIVINSNTNFSDSAERYFNYKEYKNNLTHELGHVLDYFLGHVIHRDNLYFSKTDPHFNHLFEEGKKALTEDRFAYARTTPAEFFAEVFQFMYSEELFNGVKLSQLIRSRIPDTIKYIENLLNQHAGNEIPPKRNVITDKPFIL